MINVHNLKAQTHLVNFIAIAAHKTLHEIDVIHAEWIVSITKDKKKVFETILSDANVFFFSFFLRKFDCSQLVAEIRQSVKFIFSF